MSSMAVTTSQGEILIMLYDGAIKFLTRAKEKIQERKYADKGVLLSRAIDIIAELDGSLNVEKGGDLAENLHKLYFFCNARILKASVRMETEHIDEVIRILSGLRDAYKQIISGQGNAADPGPVINQIAPPLVEPVPVGQPSAATAPAPAQQAAPTAQVTAPPASPAATTAQAPEQPQQPQQPARPSVAVNPAVQAYGRPAYPPQAKPQTVPAAAPAAVTPTPTVASAQPAPKTTTAPATQAGPAAVPTAQAAPTTATPTPAVASAQPAPAAAPTVLTRALAGSNAYRQMASRPMGQQPQAK